MLDQIFWNVFEKTGSLEAYLCYKSYPAKKEEMHRIEEESKNRAVK
ncbi:YqzL family protein [Alkaliphilus crotonatoxidans]